MMLVLVNGAQRLFDEVEFSASLNEVTRQFTIVDISDKLNCNIGDIVEIYSTQGELLIKASIEYIEARINASTNEFVYAGRNDAKYIVDSDLSKTVQFAEKQKAQTVLSEIVESFGLKIVGQAQLPVEDMKTILIGDKIIDGLLELAQSAGKILTSDAEGNILIEFQGEEIGAEVLEVGTNVVARNFKHDTTGKFEKYMICAQSNFLISSEQDVFVKGFYGDGKKERVKVVKNSLTSKECEDLAKIEFQKDERKTFSYGVEVNNMVLHLNKRYHIKDEQIGINEQLNCKEVRIVLKNNSYSTFAEFEKVVK